MHEQKRKQYSAQFKFRVALEAVKSEYGFVPNNRETCDATGATTLCNLEQRIRVHSLLIRSLNSARLRLLVRWSSPRLLPIPI